MFTKLLAYVKAKKAMRLMKRAKKLRDDLLDFIKEEPSSVTILTMIPITASFTTVMAAMNEMVSKKVKKNEEKKEE